MNQKSTRIMNFPAAALFALALLSASPSAFAACSSPAGNGGDIVFSSSTNIMAYCNGSVWINMGQSMPVSFGTLTTGDFCTAASGSQIQCTTAQISLTSQVTGTLPVGNGGTGLTSITTNGIIYGQGSSAPVVTAAGSQYNVFVAGASGVPGFGQVNLAQSAAVTGTLGVSNGGTGAGSFTQYGVILGNGTGALGVTAVGATGTVLIGNTGANPTFSANPSVTNLTLSGAEMLSFGSNYSTTGVQSDVAINTTSAVRYTGAGTATFQGIVAGTNGQILMLHNASSSTLTLANESSSESTLANRIITGINNDMPVPSNTSVSLQYDATTARWRVTGASIAASVTAAGSNTQVQFNDNGAMAGDATMTWDKTNKLLQAGTGAVTPVAATGTVAGVTVNVIPQAVSLSGSTVSGGVTIGTASTVGQLGYYAGSNSLAGASSAYWDNTNGRLGIGTNAPQMMFAVSANAAAIPGTLPPGTLVDFANVDGTATRVAMDGFAVSPNLTFRRADTTAASPSAVQSSEGLGSVTFWGYGATGYSSSARASMNGYAAQNWTDTAQGTYLNFYTTPIGTTAPAEVMRIDSTGYVGIGTTSPSAKLDSMSTSTAAIFENPLSNTGYSGGTPVWIRNSGTSANNNYLLFTEAWNGTSGTNFGSLSYGANNSFTVANPSGSAVVLQPAGGNVGIGTTLPGYPLDIETTVNTSVSSYGYLNSAGGTGFASGTASSNFSLKTAGRIVVGAEIDAVSDARLKNIEFDVPPDVALRLIGGLKPISFKWKSNPHGPSTIGFTAQSVEKVVPNAVISMKTARFPDERSLDYNQIVTLTVGAIQELKSLFGSDHETVATDHETVTDDHAALLKLEAEFEAYKKAHP